MSANFAVVAWNVQGGESLNPEEVEVCTLKKLIIKDAIPKPGSSVCLQFKQTLWEEEIVSIHGMSNLHLLIIVLETIEAGYWIMLITYWYMYL